MRTRTSLALGLAAAAAVTCGRTASPPPAHGAAAERPGPCAAAATQIELTQCWGGESRRLEAAARDEFQRVATLLREREETAALDGLRRADAAWVAYRDAQCGALRVAAAGGSIGPMQEAQCRASLAEQRRRTLVSLMTDLRAK